jgi:hypothetical protein
MKPALNRPAASCTADPIEALAAYATSRKTSVSDREKPGPRQGERTKGAGTASPKLKLCTPAQAIALGERTWRKP